MKLKITFALIAAMALLVGCNETPSVEPLTPQIPDPPKKDTVVVDEPIDTTWYGNSIFTIDADHYVLSFYRPQEFELYPSYNGPTLGLYCQQSGVNYNYRDDPNGYYGQKYSALCERYDDVNYSKVREFVDYYDGGYDFLADNIVSIELFAQTDYDEQRPAGSSLNDICVIEYQSPRKHIANGYVGKIEPITKPLTECTPDDFVLMGDGYIIICSMRLTKLHTHCVEQQIMARITDEAGNVFTSTTQPFKWECQ